jgi:hypothetical protein
MNWKGFGRKWSWPNFKVLSWFSRGETEKNHKKVSQDPIIKAENLLQNKFLDSFCILDFVYCGIGTMLENCSIPFKR